MQEWTGQADPLQCTLKEVQTGASFKCYVVWFVWNDRFLHIIETELLVTYQSQKFSISAQDKMNTLPRTAGTFQTEAKTCSEKEKALTETEEKKVNYGFVT